MSDMMMAMDGLSPASPSASSGPKRRRTAGNAVECCRTCRLRKVKCGGNPGNAPCNNCARLELSCSFVKAEVIQDIVGDKVARSTPSASHTEAGTLRKRAQRACSQCHLHKTKCSGDLPRCKRCETGGFACEYTPAKRKFNNTRLHSSGKAEEASSPISTPTPGNEGSLSPSAQLRTEYNALLVDVRTLNAEEMLLRRDFLLRHMDIFMEYLYFIPSLGFINPEVWYSEIREMTISAPKAAALCSITCFLNLPGEEGREYGLKCAAVVDMYLLHCINTFSEEIFMLLSINTLFYLLHGSFIKVWNCFGMLSRVMLGMQVNWDAGYSPNQSFEEQERIRRMAWQVFSMDRLLAGGYDEYIACRAEHMKIRLPCADSAFRANTPVITDRLHDKPSKDQSALGLHGWQIRTIDLRHRIQVATKKLIQPTECCTFEPSKVMAEINGLQNELSRLHLSFPAHLKLDKASLENYMASPERAGYVYLHSHVGVAHIDLYRFALPGSRGSSAENLRKLPREFVLQSQRQAVAHALSVARFINAVRTESDKYPSPLNIRLYGDYSMTHMSTESIRVLLVALQYDLFHNLAAYTTAPPWANAQTSKTELLSLVNGMLEATETWAQVFTVTKVAYDCNKAMVEDFYKTQTYVERQFKTATDTRRESIATGASPNGTTDLPTGSPSGQDAPNSESSPSERWMNAPRSSTSSSDPYSPVSGAFDPSYGPPGIPIFLEHARGSANHGFNTIQHPYIGFGDIQPLNGLPQQQLMQEPPMDFMMQQDSHINAYQSNGQSDTPQPNPYVQGGGFQ